MDIFQKVGERPVHEASFIPLTDFSENFVIFCHNILIVEGRDILVSDIKQEFPEIRILGHKLEKKLLYHDWIKEPFDRIVFLVPKRTFFDIVLPRAEFIDFVRIHFWRPVWFKVDTKKMPEPVSFVNEIYVLGLVSHDSCIKPENEAGKVIFTKYNPANKNCYDTAVRTDAHLEWGVAKQLEEYRDDIVRKTQNG